MWKRRESVIGNQLVSHKARFNATSGRVPAAIRDVVSVSYQIGVSPDDIPPPGVLWAVARGLNARIGNTLLDRLVRIQEPFLAAVGQLAHEELDMRVFASQLLDDLEREA